MTGRRRLKVMVKSPWLVELERAIRRDSAAIRKLDERKVELDIEARRHDIHIARRFVAKRLRLNRELDKIGVSEEQWCRDALGNGNSLRTMRRRIQLLRGWDRYLKRRRAIGDNGWYGLEFAVYLAKPECGTNGRPATVHDASGTLDPARINLITGDALTELRKLTTASVDVSPNSPPYYPARRNNFGGHTGIGFEPTLADYIANLVETFREMKRVLKPGGVLWVVIDDSISSPATRYDPQSYHARRFTTKLKAHPGFISQSTTDVAAAGNWLFIPQRLAMAMQQAGWICRDVIIWDKGPSARKENTTNRCRHNWETVLMFTKRATGYHFDQDPLRIPLGKRRYSVPRSRKQGILRRDLDRDFRVLSNPMGRIPDAVWHIPAEGYRGTHSAVFPLELVRRFLLLSCPDDPNSTVLDIFGGVGSTALVASQMGFRAISIEQNPAYTEEARQRILNAPITSNDELVAANDNQPSKTVAGN